jgi:hydroxymethylglutaryl-CoA reductase (NADPH)
MVALTRSGGVRVRVEADENRVCPVFLFDDVADAARFARAVVTEFDAIRSEAEATTTHGRLVRIVPYLIGREVTIAFCYDTADAHGMNMIVKATERACAWIASRFGMPRFYIFSGLSAEKRAAGVLFQTGKGKAVVAGARIPAAVARAYLHVEPARLIEFWRHAVVGHFRAGSLGCNGQLANGLTAIFIACGQDVANVTNSSVGITSFDLAGPGDLYASVSLPSLVVATVGGGTNLGTSRECLELLTCRGSGRARRLAEIVAATLLAGELSMAAAIANGEFGAAHERYGRNRDPADTPVPMERAHA